jgi:hypothetical protein
MLQQMHAPPFEDPDLEAAAAAAASPNPNLETAAQPAAAASMHRVTGRFADPSHEATFAAQLFRMAYPTHVFLMALVLTYSTWSALMEPHMRAYLAVSGCALGFGLIGRMLLHRIGRHDPMRSQWMGSWAWIVLTALSNATDVVEIMVAPAAACESYENSEYMLPFVFTSLALVMGTQGLGFASKFALIAMALVENVVWVAACHNPELDPWLVCSAEALVIGSAATHTAELFLRRSYAEKVLAKIQLEERNEQLKAEKERLLYDVQRGGRPLEDEDDRSAIRRGLLAGSSQTCLLNGGETDPSEPGGAPSDTPLTLPPGPPSSASSASVASYGQTQLALEALLAGRTVDAGAAQQSTTAPALLTSQLEMASEPEVMEAVLTELVADEKAVLELQGMLDSQPAQAFPVVGVKTVAGVRVVRQPVVAHRVYEAVNSTPPTPPEATLMPDPGSWLTEMFNELDEGHNDGGAGSEPQEPHLPVGPPGSLDPDQDSMTPRQWALHVARQRLQLAHTTVESQQVVQRLAVALGATRTERGTIKALHAVLLQMDWPGMSEKEATTATGASLSNFQRWRRRVQYARFDLPPP